MYGSDQYVQQYNHEIGLPVAKLRTSWIRVSYPFFHADRIRTPTLFIGGEKDFNVPIDGSEQMYQALRTLGVPTQLVIYPGQYHLLTRPSYIRERLVAVLGVVRQVLESFEVESHGQRCLAHGLVTCHRSKIRAIEFGRMGQIRMPVQG